jgi:hypothetical protein
MFSNKFDVGFFYVFKVRMIINNIKNLISRVIVVFPNF